MAFGEILQRFWNQRKNFDRMIGDLVGEAMNGFVQFGRNRINGKPFERIDKRVCKTVQPVAMFNDALALDLVQNLSHLRRRVLAMVEERDESRDRAFEINIVLPQGIVRIDEKVLCSVGHLSSHYNIITLSCRNRLSLKVAEKCSARISRMIKVAGALFLSFVFLATTSVSQTTSPSKPTKRKVMTGSAARGASSAGLKVAPDLDTQLAKFRRVQMPFDSKGLSSRERQMVEKLVLACKYLEDIFWRQNDPEGLTLYQSLAPSQNPRDVKLRRYVWINASRFDLLNDNRPFIGTEPMPPGRGFYPVGLTQAQIEQDVKDHPDKKAQLYSQFTVVRWHGAELEGLPYRIAYRSFLEPAAKALREAAKLSDDAAFAKFLQLRADALLSDDYYPSDIAWLELKNPKFDLIFAPYETYLDGLLGVKGSYRRGGAGSQ